MMAGGSPPPALYEHADGGTYRGSWLGPRKQGLGTYTYPSGGQYQGLWQNNLKEGYGVYNFPKVSLKQWRRSAQKQQVWGKVLRVSMLTPPDGWL